VSVEPVGGQVVAGQQVPHPVRPLVGGPTATPAGTDLVAGTDRGWCPLAAWVWLQVEGPELVHADHHGGITLAGGLLAVSDPVELQDTVLLGLIVGVGAEVSDCLCKRSLQGRNL
jgi:hypothetical protein